AAFSVLPFLLPRGGFERLGDGRAFDQAAYVQPGRVMKFLGRGVSDQMVCVLELAHDILVGFRAQDLFRFSVSYSSFPQFLEERSIHGDDRLQDSRLKGSQGCPATIEKVVLLYCAWTRRVGDDPVALPIAI